MEWSVLCTVVGTTRDFLTLIFLWPLTHCLKQTTQTLCAPYYFFVTYEKLHSHIAGQILPQCMWPTLSIYKTSDIKINLMQFKKWEWNLRRDFVNIRFKLHERYLNKRHFVRTVFIATSIT